MSPLTRFTPLAIAREVQDQGGLHRVWSLVMTPPDHCPRDVYSRCGQLRAAFMQTRSTST
ncbi:hypothetical protein [uncultured Hydrogenophaga sp.]|uniref:hypothetical protein n=1 Tax=uncultured Hydrogenophaga sp. TaxID=199683 RepID=UPI00265D8943|nr:hypothetical protein [uncultured Hydrogenophaga sp.]